MKKIYTILMLAILVTQSFAKDSLIDNLTLYKVDLTNCILDNYSMHNFKTFTKKNSNINLLQITNFNSEEIINIYNSDKCYAEFKLIIGAYSVFDKHVSSELSLNPLTNREILYNIVSSQINVFTYSHFNILKDKAYGN